MTTAYTSLLGLALPVTGELSGTWGDVVNQSITSLLDTSVAGTTNVSADSNVTLTTTTGASNQARQAILLFSGSRTAIRTVTAPAQSKIYTVINATTGGFAVTLVGAGPTTGLTIPNGASATVAWNGSDFIEVGTSSIGNLTVNGNLTVTGNTTLGDASTDTLNVANGNLILNSSGNLGLGVTPSVNTLSKGFDLVGGAGMFGYSNNNYLTANTYYDGAFKYKANGFASYYGQGSGAHQWHTAASGTAGNAITFTQAMTLDANGSLIVGSTSSMATSASTRGQVSINGSTDSVFSLGVAGTYTGFVYTAASTMNIGSRTSIPLTFHTVDAERMRLDTSGNLGLGVIPSPWGILRGIDIVSGAGFAGAYSTAYISGNAYFNGTSWIYKATAAAAVQEMGSGFAWKVAPSGTAGNAVTFTQAMTLSAAGDLLVKTTSPSYSDSTRGNITIGGTGGSILGFQIGGVNKGYVFHDNANLQLWNEVSGPILFGTNATERARIDSSGNLLVGTTAASLSSNTFFKNAGSSLPCLYLLKNSSASSTDQVFCVANGNAGGTVSFQVLASGNAQNTNNSYGAISDERLKENIVDASPKLTDLMQVRVRNFNLIADETKSKQIGVVAQELEQVFPMMIEETNEGTKSVKYSVFVPMLIKAIQEQQAIIELLKARLDAANL
jgi:hypothetical protein